MKKMSQVLIESQETRRQIIGNLVRLRNGEIESYCALGALGCEAGLITSKGNNVDYNLILKSYGVDPSTIVTMPKGRKGYEGSKKEIVKAIYKLNDSYGWDFKKIGGWLKKLEKNGVI